MGQKAEATIIEKTSQKKEKREEKSREERNETLAPEDDFNMVLNSID